MKGNRHVALPRKLLEHEHRVGDRNAFEICITCHERLLDETDGSRVVVGVAARERQERLGNRARLELFGEQGRG